jgi:hypothetical protein
MISKKIVLNFSWMVSLIILSTFYFGTYALCRNIDSCASFLHYVVVYFLFTIPFFLLSLITYKMRDEVYKTWFKFAQIWIILSVFLIIISPEYGGGLIPLDKGRVSLALSVIFLVISLILILIKYLSFKNKASL